MTGLANGQRRVLVLDTRAAASDPADPVAVWLGRAARALAHNGHRVELMTPAADPGAPQAGTAIVERRIPTSNHFDLRRWLAIRAALHRLRPDLVVAADSASARAVRRSGGLPSTAALFYCVAPGRLVSLAAGEPALALPERLADGLELAAAEDRIPLRRALRLPSRATIAIQASDLAPNQGHLITLQALAALLRSAPQSRLTVVFVGTGPDESQLHVASHELGVKDSILWVGYRKDPERWIAASNILLVPQETPRSSQMLAAAAAAGVAVIAADTGAHRERVESDVTGLLVPAGDAGAMGKALEALSTDPAHAERLGNAARARAARRWSAARLAAELECLAGVHALRQGVPTCRRAVFVDRDGTLIRNVPYNADPSAVQLEPDAAQALRWLHGAGFAVVVVSNQSAVARGLATEADVQAVNDRMRDLLAADGARLDAVYYCPHHPDHGPRCECRKPEPGLLLRAAREHGIDLGSSFMVGDEERDREAGRRAGTTAIVYAGDWIATAHAVLECAAAGSAISAPRRANEARAAETRPEAAGGG